VPRVLFLYIRHELLLTRDLGLPVQNPASTSVALR